MAELGSRTQLGAAMGDTFNGLTVCGIRVDGDYVWRPAVLMAGTRADGADIAAGVSSKYVDAEHLKTAIDALDTTDADSDAAIAALEVSQAAQDTLLASTVTQTQFDNLQAQITANVDNSVTAITPEADGSFTVSWETGPDTTMPAPAVEPKDTTPTALSTNAVESQGILAALGLKEDSLPIDTALRWLRRNAANDGWELADIPITAQNLIAGAGAPQAGDGNDGDYYTQLDAALGDNDVWGPKAAGAWPVQADFKTADPNVGTESEENTGTEIAPRAWAPATLSQIRLGHENFTPLADGGTAEVGTGRLVSPGGTIGAPTARPNGQPLAAGDYFQLALDADGAVTVTGTAETPTLAGLQASSHAWCFIGGQWVDLDPEITQALTTQEITSTTGTDYTEEGTVTSELLDQWGQSRRVSRIFSEDAPFDYTSLGYADRTAIFIRNPNAVNGKGITYGAGGAVTLQVTLADGQQAPVAGLDEYTLQPNEWAVFEKDGNTAKLNIISGERVSYFDDYADAVVKAPTRVAHDGLAIIRNPGEVWGRKTKTNSVAFPANGVPTDDWFKVISQDPQSLLLNYINVEMRSAGTNAGSNVSIQFVDIDGNTYPDGDWVYSADLTQYSGGTATIVTDKVQWTGTMGIGRNKAGTVKFYYIGATPNGLSAINATPANGGSTQGVQVSYLGTNYFDDFANVAAVIGPLYWTTSQIATSTDQAAPIVDAAEYVAGSVFSMPEPDNTDPDYQTWFNWRVSDGETIADTDVPNGTEAEFLAIKPKLTRFGIGTSSSGTDDRIIDTAGIMGLDPLNTLSNTDKSEFIHWTVVNQPLTARLLPAPSFVTTWIDYSGNNITQPAAANSDFVIPAGVQMWVHRVGNAVSVVFEPSEGGSSEGLQRIELSPGDNTFADATYTIDYSAYQGQQFESELFVIGERTITFAEPVMGVGAARKTRIHRVFINANTADVTVTFPAGTWKAADTADDMADVIIPLGQSRTLELVVGDSTNTEYVRVLGGANLPEIVTGQAVERDVIQANRGGIMSFGDLQFRVPSSGNSSLQMRSPSGVVTISEFTTKWSNQQGGASENSFGFSLGSAWAYFRANGSLNLTLHNSYQDATFVCNGWLYRVEVIVGSGWTNNRFSFSRWRLEGIKGDPGTDGVDAASVDHISLTAGDSSPGTTDTYTLWRDAGETVALGTYDVPIPAVPAGITTVDLGSYVGAFTTGQLITLAGGRTWQDVLDEFQFVYVMVGGNSLFSHDQTAQFHVSDLTSQSRDMAVTGYMTHGSNAYHMRMITPATNATQVSINNDNSSMQVQRIKVVGIK